MTDKEQKTRLVPVVAFELLKAVGFITRYYANTQTCRTYKEAYYKTEDEYLKYFYTNRYSSYESFKAVLTYYRKKQKDGKEKNKGTPTTPGTNTGASDKNL